MDHNNLLQASKQGPLQVGCFQHGGYVRVKAIPVGASAVEKFATVSVSTIAGDTWLILVIYMRRYKSRWNYPGTHKDYYRLLCYGTEKDEIFMYDSREWVNQGDARDTVVSSENEVSRDGSYWHSGVAWLLLWWELANT